MNFSVLAFKFGLLFTAAICSPIAADADGHLRDDVMVLMYETDGSLKSNPSSPLYFFQEKGKIAKIQTTVYGGELSYNGFGDKYQTLRPLLEVMDENKLVILADARDVILNVPNKEAVAAQAVDNFVKTYRKLTVKNPNAVVMSAEAQCCVSAMAHANPSEYFDSQTKERKKRACSSGKEDCLWYPSENIEHWQTFMEDLAFDATGEDPSDVYLNAGLMVGYPSDLINLLNLLDIHPYEDDQAVLSGLMYQFPEMIKLDYKQEMFGNNQWPRGLADGCVFETQGDHLSLIHTETGTEPLLVHTPGKFYDCLDVLIEDLGGVSQQRYLLDAEHMDAVASNKGFTVTSDASRRRTMESHTGGRRLFFLERVKGLVFKIKQLMWGETHTEPESEAEPESKEEIDGRVEINDETEGPINYGNYGPANYGATNYGATNYGATNYGATNYGATNYGATNYGNAGNYANGGQNYGGMRRRRLHTHKAD